MKKLTHILVALMVTFAAVLSLSACGKNPVTSATASGLPLSVAKGDTLDTSNVIVTATYKKGEAKEFSGDDLSFGDFSTAELGTFDLEITIVPEDFSFEVSIKVVASEADVNAITQLESELVKEYNANRTATSENEDFVHDDITLRAGTINPFHFRLKTAGIAADGETLLENIANVRTNVKVELLEDSTYREITGTELSTYVAVNTINAVLDFEDAAIGRTFRITVSAANPDEGYEAANYTFNAVVDVIKGFNVYDIVDMSVYDNYNIESNANRAGDWLKDTDKGWTPYHNEVIARYDAIEDLDDIKAIDTLILQANIKVNGTNIRQDALWDSADPNYSQYATLTDQTLAGTPHNSDNKGIFQRVIKTGENFSIIGNYFAIDISELPKMVVYNEDDYVNYEDGAAMTGYFSLFKTDPAADFQFTADHDTSITYETMSFIGNGGMDADVRNSGSVLLMKHDEVNFTGYNTIANQFYTTYYFAYGNPNNPNDGEYVVEDCKAFNSYTSAIYIYGGENVTLINSVFKNSGGPAILADTFSYEGGRAGDYDETTETLEQFIYSGKDQYPTINIVNTVLEAYASGREPWYNEYDAGEAVGLMAMLGDCITGKNFFAGSQYTDTGSTIVADMKDTTPRINVQCVFFGEDIIENKDHISGVLNVYDTVTDYENKTATNQSLDLTNTNPYIAGALNNGLPIFQCTETGSFRSAPILVDNDPTDGDSTMLAPEASGAQIVADQPSGWTGDHVNLYLPSNFGSMGVLLGLYPATAA